MRAICVTLSFPPEVKYTTTRVSLQHRMDPLQSGGRDLSLQHRMIPVGIIMSLALGALGLVVWLAGAQGTGATVHFAPPAVRAQAGVPFTMTIAITQATDLGGFEFDLLFNPEVITVTGMHLGDFLGRSGRPTVPLGPAGVGIGRLVFGGFSYGEQEGASGWGSLATLELRLLKDAETVLRLDEVQLVTSQAELAPLRSVGEGLVRPGVSIYLPLIWRGHPLTFQPDSLDRSLRYLSFAHF